MTEKLDLFSAKFKSLQGLYLQEVKDYFESTKSNHYAKTPLAQDRIEAIDVIDSLGFLKQFALGNVVKYVMRFGHKDGYNKKDIYKAIQYLIWLVIYVEHHAIEEDESSSS